MMISRSRCDIRKCKKTKEESNRIKQAIVIGNEIKKAWDQIEWHPAGIRTQQDFYYQEAETTDPPEPI